MSDQAILFRLAHIPISTPPDVSAMALICKPRAVVVLPGMLCIHSERKLQYHSATAAAGFPGG